MSNDIILYLCIHHCIGQKCLHIVCSAGFVQSKSGFAVMAVD